MKSRTLPDEILVKKHVRNSTVDISNTEIFSLPVSWCVCVCVFRVQITTLINHKDKPKKSEKTLRALQRVGQAVSAAVGRFVAVGEAIATENEELKEEMGLACVEARKAGEEHSSLSHTSYHHCLTTSAKRWLLLGGYTRNVTEVLRQKCMSHVDMAKKETVSRYCICIYLFAAVSH